MAGTEEDDDDWVGEPPEGHYTRDRADPGFWAGQKPVPYLAAAVLIVIVVIVVIVLLG
jgi:hypothetical protein